MTTAAAHGSAPAYGTAGDDQARRFVDGPVTTAIMINHVRDSKEWAVVPVEGRPFVRASPEQDQELKTMQEIVGGWVQWVPLREGGGAFGIWLNEEGAYSLPRNPLAEKLFGSDVCGGQIHGPVLLRRNPDE